MELFVNVLAIIGLVFSIIISVGTAGVMSEQFDNKAEGVIAVLLFMVSLGLVITLYRVVMY